MKALDKNEVLRYMAQRETPSTELGELVDAAIAEVSAAASPRYASGLFSVKANGNTVFIGELEIKSKNLAKNLNGCAEAVIFAATLGAQTDRVIARQSKVDSAAALCMQAAGAALIENVCDEIENSVAAEAEKKGLFIRPRFSPGYGDLDIAHQTDILAILQADKKIGLAETAGHMLVPLKSVTAIIGLANCEARGEGEECKACGKEDCEFKKPEKE